MIIDEAIRILKIMEEDCDRLNEPFSKRAVKLGIEALEAYQELRQCTAIDIEDIGRLSSETGGGK